MAARKKTPSRLRRPPEVLEDPIADVIKTLKHRGQKDRKRINWPDVERDLRSVCVEYRLSHKQYLLGQPTAGIAASRRRIREAQQAAAMAARLPRRLATLAIEVFGTPGQSLVDRRDVELYVVQLGKLEAAINTYEALFQKALRHFAQAKGRKGPLVDHLIGTPTQRFLVQLRRIWRDATGGSRLGEDFKAMAKSLIDAFQPPHMPEVGDLDRQIENSKKFRPNMQTVFDVFTEFLSGDEVGGTRPPR